jgi:hypothetical protein
LQQNLSHISSHSSFVLFKKEKKHEGEILLFYTNSSNIEFGLCYKKAISFKSWLVTQNPFTKLHYFLLMEHYFKLTILTPFFFVAQENAPKSSPPYTIESKKVYTKFIYQRIGSLGRV